MYLMRFENGVIVPLYSMECMYSQIFQDPLEQKNEVYKNQLVTSDCIGINIH